MASESPPSPMAVTPPSPTASPRHQLQESTSSARNSLKHSSSSKGWSPLQITKRDRDASNSTTSPLRPNDTGSSMTSSTGGYGHILPTGIPAPRGTTRRTSSSFRHMATNSLVAKSPFKDLKTREGALSNGYSPSSDGGVIHERRSTNRALGEAPKAAYGSASTPRHAIGLGVSTSRSAGLAVSGQRKVSNERKVSIPSSVDRYDNTDADRKERRERRERKERKERKERRSSGSKENEPRRALPRKSLAYRATVEGERVTKSPFLSERDHQEYEDYDEGHLSPSPRRVSSSNRRRASPSANLTSGRTSMSPSVSPQPSRAASGAIQSSPLVQEFVPPSPTPTKSALAASKRLVGPRGLGSESPTRKTVTFQAVPDVKEFEVLSRDTSVASIVPTEVEADVDDDDWIDDNDADWVGKVIRDERDTSQESEDIPHGDTSATADFMDSLIEEGLFSPQDDNMEENIFDDESFEIPMESLTDYIENGDRDDGADTPVASSTPKLEYRDLPVPESPHHVHTIHPHAPPTEQPNLPHSEDHTMLLNANAAQPAIGANPASPGPHAHQEGPLYDPFLTIQTATDVLVPHKERSEGDVPLGRTSHAERVQAARILATQKLGLGFPGHLPRAAPPVHEECPSDYDSPIAHSKTPDTDVFGAVIASPAARKISDRKVSDVPELEGPSKRMSQFRAARPATPTKTPTRKPLPPPAPIEVPSPVQIVSPRTSGGTLEESETDMSDAEATTAKRTDLTPMTLPMIGTSPLMTPVQSEDEHMTEDEAPPVPDKDLPPVPTSGRVSDVAPKLSLSAELEEIEPEEPTTPTASQPHPRDLTPELADVSGQLAQVAHTPGRFDDAESEGDEPLTPPPALGRKVREESPRIPSLEFEAGLGLGASEDEHEEPASPSPATPRPITIITAPSPSPGSPSRSAPGTPQLATPTRGRSPVNQSPLGTPTRGTPSRPAASSPLASAPVTSVEVEQIDPETSIIASEFGENNGSFEEGSTQTRIRQRISREMIRETVNQRVAAGGLSRPKSMIEGPRLSMIDAPRRRNISPLRIQPRSPRIPKSSSSGQILDSCRTPTSPTASAALQQLRDSNDSPQSALDRIMNQLGQDSRAPSAEPLSPTKVITPVNVLRTGPETTDEPEIPPSLCGSIINAPPDAKTIRAARKSRRRSASTSDATPGRIRSPRLTLGGIGKDNDSILDSVVSEIEHIGSQRGYRVRQRSEVRVTYTGGLDESQAGNLEIGKAWRPVRRPSDMNEHTKDIKAARAREASEGKASGTIFVKVLGIESLSLPLPSHDTYFCITLDNGIDYIRTPYSVLKEGAHVNQEFSLVEHKNFEFSLSLDVRRDPHILKLIEERANAKAAVVASTKAREAALAASTTSRLEPPPRPPPVRPQSPVVSVSSMASRSSGFGSGFRSLFSSPRKNRHQRTQSTPSSLSQSTSVLPSLHVRKPAPAPTIPPVAPPPPETLAKYIVETGGNTIAKTHIAFKPIAKQCEAKVLEIRYPMFAMFKPEGSTARQQVAKVTIQILRLPPLPGLSLEELPGSIEDTLRGLRHHAWHLHEYNEGVLTQLGGDCRVPRRRLFRLVGGNLLAINEVTKKEVATIDLREAISVIDLNAPNPGNDDDYDPYSARPRSFRLKFKDGEGISFSADRDEDKAVWMDTFTGLIGRIPTNPLWAQMLAEHEEEPESEEEKRRASKNAPRRSGRMSTQAAKVKA